MMTEYLPPFDPRDTTILYDATSRSSPLAHTQILTSDQVLEIKGDEITILTEYKSVPAHKRAASAPPAPAAGDDDELRRQ